jgi:hypothetical protein
LGDEALILVDFFVEVKTDVLRQHSQSDDRDPLVSVRLDG